MYSSYQHNNEKVRPIIPVKKVNPNQDISIYNNNHKKQDINDESTV